MRSASESGQALVIILLSLAVVLTLVLFILSRTITDVSISTSEEEAIRAFSAAEAGVEKALIIGSTGDETIGDASFNAEVTDYAEASPTYNFLFNLNSGDIATVWLATNDGEGNLTPYFNGDSIKVCWGRDNTAIDTYTPAIEVSTFYNSSGSTLIRRAALDPNATGRSPANSFTNVTNRNCTIDGVTYEFWSNVSLPVGVDLLFIRIRMLYNTNQDQIVGVDVTSEGLLPSQGKKIDSTGQSGESERRLEVIQTWPEPPPIFDYAVFSAGSLVK